MGCDAVWPGRIGESYTSIFMIEEEKEAKQVPRKEHASSM
jgi:hypothetical protein